MILPDDKLPVVAEIVRTSQGGRFDEQLLSRVADNVCNVIGDDYFAFTLFPNRYVPSFLFYSNNPSSFFDVYVPVADQDILMRNLVETGSLTNLQEVIAPEDQQKNEFCVVVQKARPISDVCYVPLKYRNEIVGYTAVARAGLNSPVHSKNDVEMFQWLSAFIARTFVRSLQPPPPDTHCAFLDASGTVVSAGPRMKAFLRSTFGDRYWRRPGHGSDALSTRFSAWCKAHDRGFARMGDLTLFLHGRPFRLRFARIEADPDRRYIPHAPQIRVVLADDAGEPDQLDAIDWKRAAYRYTLTAREVQVARCLWRGYSNREIAQHLGISEATVKRHLANVYEKTGLHSRTKLMIGLAP